MRNLLEHPVTHDEIIECLERHKKKARYEGAPGDIDELLLDLAIAAVQYRQLKLWERGDIKAMNRALKGDYGDG
jgi:hypothetical protein